VRLGRRALIVARREEQVGTTEEGSSTHNERI
jgi:hypothetical protein